MKWLMPFVVLVLLVGAFFAFKHVKMDSLWRAGVRESRLVLRRALSDIAQTGALRNHGNSVSAFTFTNSLTAAGTTYVCAVAYDAPKFYGRGFVAATTNGTFLWVERAGGAKLLASDGKP